MVLFKSGEVELTVIVVYKNFDLSSLCWLRTKLRKLTGPSFKDKPRTEKMIEASKKPKSEETKDKLRNYYLFNGKLIVFAS